LRLRERHDWADPCSVTSTGLGFRVSDLNELIAKQNIARADWGPFPGRRHYLFSPWDCSFADLSVVQRPAQPFASQRFQSAMARNGSHRNAVATNCAKGPQQDFPVIALTPPTMPRSGAGGYGATSRPETILQCIFVVMALCNSMETGAARRQTTRPIKKRCVLTVLSREARPRADLGRDCRS
jgi:hypothetical protein